LKELDSKFFETVLCGEIPANPKIPKIMQKGGEGMPITIK
jgi:hypothetical protein